MEYIHLQLAIDEYRLLERLVQAKKRENALKEKEIAIEKYKIGMDKEKMEEWLKK